MINVQKHPQFDEDLQDADVKGGSKLQKCFGADFGLPRSCSYNMCFFFIVVSEEAVCCFSQIWHLILISRVYFSLIGMLDDYSGLFCLLESLIHTELGIKIKFESGGQSKGAQRATSPASRKGAKFHKLIKALNVGHLPNSLYQPVSFTDRNRSGVLQLQPNSVADFHSHGKVSLFTCAQGRGRFIVSQPVIFSKIDIFRCRLDLRIDEGSGVSVDLSGDDVVNLQHSP